MTQQPFAGAVPDPLLAGLRQLIDATRQQTAVAVNMGLTLLHWRVGQCINAEVFPDGNRVYALSCIDLPNGLVAVKGGVNAQENTP